MYEKVEFLQKMSVNSRVSSSSSLISSYPADKDKADLAPPFLVSGDIDLEFLVKVLHILPLGLGDGCLLETTAILGRVDPLVSYLLARSFSEIS